MTELRYEITESTGASRDDQPDAVIVPLPDGVSGKQPGNSVLTGEVDGDETFGNLEDGVVGADQFEGYDTLDDSLTSEDPVATTDVIPEQPNSEHDELAKSDESGDSANVTPFEAATRIIPEDRWHETPRYSPVTYNSEDPDSSELDPGFKYIAPAYGERVVEGEVQACSLEDMEAIHQEIADILGDEHSHTAVLTEAPNPYNGTYGDADEVRANNAAWLTTIRNGHWPLPGHYTRLNPFDHDEQPVFETELTRDLHDTADNHIAFMLLAPREMQDQITEAAGHGITEFLEAANHPQTHGGLLLRGETADDHDPLHHSWRGTSYRSEINGMGVVDEISDEPSFIPVLQSLIQLPNSEARHEYMRYYTELASLSKSDRLDRLQQDITSTLGDKAKDESVVYNLIKKEEMKVQQVNSQMRSIVAITNYNMRHRIEAGQDEGRNMTEAEQINAKLAYAAGLVRVADKLTGDYLPQAA